MSMQNGNDALSLSYNETKLGFRTLSAHDLVNMLIGNLALDSFDEITVTYAALTDTFLLKKATAAVGTAVVTYSSATKEVASGVAYTAA